MKLIYLSLSLLIICSCAKEDELGLMGRVEQDLELQTNCRSINALLYSDYQLVNAECLLPLYFEEFSGESQWYEGTQSGVDIDIRSGKYHCEGSEDVNFYLSCWDCGGLEPDNFQLQMEIKMIEYGNSCSLNWGSLQTENIYENVYRFGLGKNGKFIIAHTKGGETQPNIIDFEPSAAIDEFGTNLLTIRKVDDWHFFFINEELVYQTQNIQVHGPYVSIRIGSESECEIDNVSMYEIMR